MREISLHLYRENNSHEHHFSSETMEARLKKWYIFQVQKSQCRKPITSYCRLKSESLWQNLIGILTGGISGKGRRVKGRMLRFEWNTQNSPAIQALIQRKARAQQQPQPTVQPPVRKMFMMREYTPTELTNIAATLQQKARLSIQAWLVQLWDPGVRGPEMQWHFSNRSGNRENEQHHHISCPLAAHA